MFYRKILTDLEKWRTSDSRKPMIIRGASQVGKTTVVNEFGKQFKQYIYLNLENPKDKELFEGYTDIHSLTERIFFVKELKLEYLKDTLLFIDELQEAPKVVNLLRYFKEEKGDLPVIAAGSMLETLLGKNISFPVGRVQFRILRPVSFEEFLGALNENMSLEQLQKVPLNDYAYSKVLSLFHTYALIGGMPEIVNHYAKHRYITALGDIYNTLLESYLTDAEKYSRSKEELQLIRFTIQQSIQYAGKRFTFEGFGNGKYKSREIGETLRTLQKTHLLHLIYPTVSNTIPAIEDYRKSPRLQFLDSGLLNHFMGLKNEILGTKDLNSVYKGTLIEHLVGQEILSYQSFPLDKLHYWVRQKNNSSAEVDFVYPFEGKIIPIEVKSGSIGKIKSLQIYMNESPLNYAIRFYAGKFSLDKVQTQEGKTFYLLNLPYFLASKTEDYIHWLQKNIPKEEKELPILKDPKINYGGKKEGLKLDLEDLPEKYLSILRYCNSKPKKGKEIIEDLLGLTYQSRNKKIYLKPLLDLGLIDYSDKEFLKSKKQTYFVTELGKNVISKQQR